MASRWLEERIALVGTRFRAGLEGLDAGDFDVHPVAGKWSLGEYVHHITEVDLGWTGIGYEAIGADESLGRPYRNGWSEAALAKSRTGIAAALDVFDENHAEVAAVLAQLPEEALEKVRPGVSWLKDAQLTFQINDNLNWGLVMHVDYSLRHMHRLRLAIGKPLAWMETVPLMHPAGSGRGKDGGDVD